MILLTYLSLLVYEVMNYLKRRTESGAYGKRQSPVDIATRDTEYNENLRTCPIDVHYDVENNMEITNTGHTVKAISGQESTISGGPLKNTYKLEQFHLHWGSNDNRGSEHTVAGISYAAELHLVHWNQERYSSISEAADKQDGLAVLGVFLKVGEEHGGLKALTDDLCDVIIPSEKSNVTGQFNPQCLLPDNIYDYWTYPGSLTTPPYSEAVTWVVFRDPIEVSLTQLEALRSLRCGHNEDDHIVDNFRQTCPINNRKITASFR